MPPEALSRDVLIHLVFTGTYKALWVFHRRRIRLVDYSWEILYLFIFLHARDQIIRNLKQHSWELEREEEDK